MCYRIHRLKFDLKEGKNAGNGNSDLTYWIQIPVTTLCNHFVHGVHHCLGFRLQFLFAISY